MKFIVATILTALLSFVSGLLSFSPWWGFAIPAFLIGLLVHQRGWKAFLSGFLGVFICAVIVAVWIDVQNNSVLSRRIAVVLPLGGSSAALIIVTGFVGGLIGGFAQLTGSLLRSTRRSRV